MKYEYYLLDTNGYSFEFLTKKLNQLGEQGWKIISRVEAHTESYDSTYEGFYGEPRQSEETGLILMREII
jgi:hypothetical protein